MSQRLIKGLFQNYADAGRVVRKLIEESNIGPERISVFAADESELRMVAAPVLRRTIDPFILCFGIGGLLAGMIMGYLAPVPVEAGYTTTTMGILGAFFGGGAGLSLGLVLGAIFHFDVPSYQSEVKAAPVERGQVMVVVRTRDHDEHNLVESLMEEADASEILSTAEMTMPAGSEPGAKTG